MESFFASIQQQWPPGRPDFHWHVLLDPEPVRALLTLPYRELVHRGGLAPVPAVWAHVTISQVAPVTDLTSKEIAQLVGLVNEDCAALKPFDLTIRQPEVWRNGIVCPVSPGPPLRRLWRIATAASLQVTGGRFENGPAVFHPHLALAYAVSHVDDPPLRAWLTEHDIPEVRLRVNQLSLVTQRHDGRNITWLFRQAVPLGTDSGH